MEAPVRRPTLSLLALALLLPACVVDIDVPDCPFSADGDPAVVEAGYCDAVFGDIDELARTARLLPGSTTGKHIQVIDRIDDSSYEKRGTTEDGVVTVREPEFPKICQGLVELHRSVGLLGTAGDVGCGGLAKSLPRSAQTTTPNASTPNRRNDTTRGWAESV